MLLINENLMCMFLEGMDSKAAAASSCVVQGDTISPLTYFEFFSSVLIPYTAVLLIQLDLSSSFDDAWTAWLESGTWGMVNHLDAHSNMATGPTEQFVNVKLKPQDEIVVLTIDPLLPKWTTGNHLDVNRNEVEVLVLDDDN